MQEIIMFGSGFEPATSCLQIILRTTKLGLNVHDI